MKSYFLDSSFIISYFSRDESNEEGERIFQEYEENKCVLNILDLTYYEVLNSFKSMVLSKRITLDEAKEMVEAFLGFEFIILEANMSKVFKISLEKNLSFYDAAYLEASQSNKVKLMTLDKKLANLVGK